MTVKYTTVTIFCEYEVLHVWGDETVFMQIYLLHQQTTEILVMMILKKAEHSMVTHKHLSSTQLQVNNKSIIEDRYYVYL